MSKERPGSLIARILAENERRRREIPADFYLLMHLPNLFMTTQRNRCLLRLLEANNITTLAGRRILDVGCGTGEWLLDFLSWGASPELLCGIDIDERQVAEAARKLPTADLRAGDAATLPWPDAFFDIILQATVFSSIPDLDFQRAVAAEMVRVAKPAGLILWYDLRFNNPRNPHVRGIRAREIRQLFPGCSFGRKRVTLLPPLARQVVPMSWLVALLLETLPFLRTHLLGCVRLRGEGHPLHARNGRRTPTDAPDNEKIRYCPMSRSLIKEVVDLHVLCFPDFFLTGLGRGILTRYYNHYDGCPDSIFFVARSSSGKVVGLVAGSRNYKEFLRTFYRAKFLALALAVARAFFRNRDLREKTRRRTPHVKTAIKSLFRTRRFQRSHGTPRGFFPFETAGMASAAVHPDFRKKGVALNLYRLFEERAKALGVRRAELSVLASNTRLIIFYKMTGWRVAESDEDYVVLEKML